MKLITTAFALLVGLSSGAQAALVSAFAENFEGTLSAWNDRSPSNPDATIVIDPLNASNHVLGFNRTMFSGSIFTTDMITAASQFTVSFDYLGLTTRGGVAGDSGGFLGIGQDGWGSYQYWLAGTNNNYNTPINLVDNDQWHHYSINVSTAVIGNKVRLMLEDWDGSGGVAGDAFFDNLRINDVNVPAAAFASQVPEPSSLALLALAGLAAFGASRRLNTKRSKRQG